MPAGYLLLFSLWCQRFLLRHDRGEYTIFQKVTCNLLLLEQFLCHWVVCSWNFPALSIIKFSWHLLVQVNHGYTRTMREILSRLAIKTPEERRCRSGVFIVNFEHISHTVLLFPLLTWMCKSRLGTHNHQCDNLVWGDKRFFESNTVFVTF